MKLYDNGEPILKTRMEDESWYPYYSSLLEIVTGEIFTYSTIDDPGVLVELFNKEWGSFRENKHYKDTFPTNEQLLRWVVFVAERHNHVYNCPKLIKAHRKTYLELSITLKDWTDWDIAMLEIAILERKTGYKEYFKEVNIGGGLPKNKFWIYDNKNEMSNHIVRVLKGLTHVGILEQHEDELQWRWIPMDRDAHIQNNKL